MKQGEVATLSSNPWITTTECAAYGSPLPPLPLGEVTESHDYEVVAQGNTAYVPTKAAGGDNQLLVSDDGVYENPDGAYATIPGEAQ